MEILEHHGNCSDTLLVNSLSLDLAVTDKVSKILATKGAQGPLRFKSAVLESELPRSAMSVPIEKIMYSYVLNFGSPGFGQPPRLLTFTQPVVCYSPLVISRKDFEQFIFCFCSANTIMSISFGHASGTCCNSTAPLSFFVVISNSVLVFFVLCCLFCSSSRNSNGCVLAAIGFRTAFPTPYRVLSPWTPASVLLQECRTPSPAPVRIGVWTVTP